MQMRQKLDNVMKLIMNETLNDDIQGSHTQACPDLYEMEGDYCFLF